MKFVLLDKAKNSSLRGYLPFCLRPKHQSSESVKKHRTCLTGPACRASWGWWFPPALPQHLVLFSSSRGATLPAACPQSKLVGHTEGVSAELWSPSNISHCCQCLSWLSHLRSQHRGRRWFRVAVACCSLVPPSGQLCTLILWRGESQCWNTEKTICDVSWIYFYSFTQMQ